MGIRKEIVVTDRAPSAIGPYSQAVKAGGFVFVSGQIALDPKSGEIVSDDVRLQARQALQNLGAILEAAGSSLEDVVKATIYMRDIQDFASVNEVYQEFFDSVRPARAAVAVAGLPKGAAVEIEAIAVAEANVEKK